MRKFLGLKKGERGSVAEPGSSAERLQAPSSAQPAGNPMGDDLQFLPPSRPGNFTGGATGLPRRAPRVDEDAVPLPGADRTRLAGLFADDDGDLFGAAPSASGSKSAYAEPVPAQPAQQTQAPQAQMLFSGSGSLYRLDDEGSAMVEVDAGEGRGCLHGCAVKMSPSADGQSTIFLIIYTAIRKRPRMKSAVQQIDIQTPNEESVCFYDENGIYWALQLGSTVEALSLTRIVLAGRCLLSGQLQTLEMAAGAGEDVVGPADVVALRSTACLRDLAADGSEEYELEESSDVELPLSNVDSRWGAGVADVIVGLCQGSSTLLALPPSMMHPRWQGRNSSGKCVVLLDLQDVYPGGTDVEPTPAQATPQKVRNDSEMSDSGVPSVKERMAKLGVSALPAIASAGVPPPNGNATTAAASLAAASAAEFEAAASPSPAAGLLAAVATPTTVPGAPTVIPGAAVPMQHAGVSNPPMTAPTFPGSGFTAPGFTMPGFTSPGVSAPSPWTQAPTSYSGPASHHPVADIMRQYWSAVQDSGAASQYAFLGALPFVPGLSMQPGKQQNMHQPAAPPAPPLAAAAPLPTSASASMAMPPSSASQVQDTESVRASSGGTASAQTGAVNMPMRTTPLSSVALGDLVEAIREVVRKEATPEGWQVERQKLERRVALLEEQLNSARTHQEQVRESNRQQLAAMQRQLAESQMIAQQMREQQLRNETDRQMRDWERDASRGALEAELNQNRSELQQLRLEERSLRDRLAEAEMGKQRAEGAAASHANVAANLPGMEARLQEQTSAAAAAQRDLQATTAQLQAMASSRPVDAVSVCKNAMSIAYIGVKQAIPGAGAVVDADAVRASLREVCKQSCLALERQLQQAPVDIGLPLGDQIDWDNVEKLALASLGPPLPDLSAGMEAAVEKATANAAEAVEKAAAEAARSAAEAKAAAARQAAAEAAAKKAAEEKLALEAESRRAAAEAAERVASERAAAAAATQKAVDEKLAAEARAAKLADEAADAAAKMEQQDKAVAEQRAAAEALAKKALAEKEVAEERASAEAAAREAAESKAARAAEMHAVQGTVEKKVDQDVAEEMAAQAAAPAVHIAENTEATEEEDFQDVAEDRTPLTAREVPSDAAFEAAEEAAAGANNAVEAGAIEATADTAQRATEEEEAARKAALEEEAAQRAAEDDVKQKAALEEESLRRAAEEEAARRVAEEQAALKAAEEQAARLAQEEAALKAAEEEAARRVAEEQAALKAAEEQAARLAQEEAAQKAAEEEEAARIVAEEQAALKAAEEQAARLVQEEAAQKAAEEEAARRVAEEQAALKAAEEQAARLAQEEAALKAAEEEEAVRRAAEEEAARKAALEEENARRAAEEEAAQKAAEKEAAARAAAEAERKAAEEEAAAEYQRKAAAAKAAKEAAKAKPAAAKKGDKGLFGETDDEDDSLFGSAPVRRAQPKPAARTNGGDLFGDDDDTPPSRGNAGSKKKPPASLFGDESDDGSFVFSK